MSDPDLALIVTVFADVVLALGAFTLSFDALRELALAAGLRPELVWIWPLVVDGFMVVSTINAVVLSERIPRAAWYPGIALVVFAMVSVAGNGLHAARHADTDVISVPVAAVVSAIPAVALLIISHLIVVLLMARRRSPGAADRSGPTAYDTSDDGIGRATGPARPSDRALDARPDSAREPASSGAWDGPRRTWGDADSLAAWVASETQAGRTVTGDDVAARIGMSSATGRRRLRAIRAALPDVATDLAQHGNGRWPADGTS
ncbi:DUF2637 domain-containing protein [Jiangella alkaliphila]|uniref:DUF2637 domain-containing protein n=1 Tax=Jiangella alkaliphila TaxID=419479 RepID=UPI001364B407|nr:DUF2637 domain-containing protein [Jiangella alkaliphila]